MLHLFQDTKPKVIIYAQVKVNFKKYTSLIVRRCVHLFIFVINEYLKFGERSA